MSLKRVVIITGFSGSGKTSAAQALEDEGFFVVDNLPLALLPQFLSLVQQGVRFTENVAVVIDVRNRDFLSGFETTLQAVRDAGHELEIYFFEASRDALIRRYSETRRRHPLATEGNVLEGISREEELLSGLKRIATKIIDSSWLTPHQLRAEVVQMVHGKAGMPLVVQIQSFGFRWGIPPDSDLVMDVRFLPNPHFVPELQPMSGLDQPVRDFVVSRRPCREFLDHFEKLLKFLIPRYQKEGKSYLTISIGCTGGRHRSISVVEELRQFFSGEGFPLRVVHRDIHKE